MTHPQAAIGPPALGEASLLPFLYRVGEEDLAGDGKDARVVEAFQQGGQEVRLDAHVGVQQDDDIVFGGPEAGIGAATEAAIRRERHQLYLRETLTKKLGAAVGGAVVDH